MASGEMTEREFTNFLRRALMNLADFSLDGSIHFVCMDWRHIRELADAADDVYTELKNICKVHQGASEEICELSLGHLTGGHRKLTMSS